MSRIDEGARQTAKVTEHTGTRHCTGCYIHRSIEGGGFIKMIKGKQRWVCSACIKNYRGTARMV
jgi:hypothetical protein